MSVLLKHCFPPSPTCSPSLQTARQLPFLPPALPSKSFCCLLHTYRPNAPRGLSPPAELVLMEPGWRPTLRGTTRERRAGGKTCVQLCLGSIAMQLRPSSAGRPQPASITGTQVLNHLLRSFLILNCPFVS